MNSRERMLVSVKSNQPPAIALPDIPVFPQQETGLADKYMMVLKAIGGAAYLVNSFDEIRTIIKDHFPEARRIVSTSKELIELDRVNANEDPHLLQDVDLAILNAHFGVAENGSVWVTEDIVVERALPFICQYLAVIIRKDNIVATMHQAYQRIGEADYGFGTFIAGPSKTADIEQSLILGAHGPKGMTVFIMDDTGAAAQ